MNDNFLPKICTNIKKKIYDSQIDLRTTTKKGPEKTHPTTVGHRSKRRWEGCCGSVNQHPLQQHQQILSLSLKHLFYYLGNNKVAWSRTLFA